MVFRIKRNKEIDKAAKIALDMPEIAKPDFYLAIRVFETLNGIGNMKWEKNTRKLYNIKPYIEEWKSV